MSKDLKVDFISGFIPVLIKQICSKWLGDPQTDIERGKVGDSCESRSL